MVFRLEAVTELYKDKLKKGKAEVYDADLSAYFDMIPHKELMFLIAKRIDILRFIKIKLKMKTIGKPSAVRSRGMHARFDEEGQEFDYSCRYSTVFSGKKFYVQKTDFIDII